MDLEKIILFGNNKSRSALVGIDNVPDQIIVTVGVTQYPNKVGRGIFGINTNESGQFVANNTRNKSQKDFT